VGETPLINQMVWQLQVREEWIAQSERMERVQQSAQVILEELLKEVMGLRIAFQDEILE
jgi:hypothetical protein